MKKLTRILCAALAVLMCAGTMGLGAAAKQVLNGNDWYGDEVAVDVTAGTEGYNFMSLFRKSVHGYEFSGHFMGDGEGPQTFVVIDTAAHDGTTWTPSGVYAPNASNYEVAYCCDVETMIADSTYYKRMNLEDSEYYNERQAAKIRAIVTNSYPYVTLDAMKRDLANNGYQYAAELTRNEIIAAVQTAIWACANTEGVAMKYAKSYRVSDNLQWGYPMYDTSSESGLDVAGKRVFKSYEEVGTRIDSLVNYLLAQDAVYADKAQIVITSMKIADSTVVVNAAEGTYKAALELELNSSGSGYEDELMITVTAGETVYATEVTTGKVKYSFDVEAKIGEDIKAVVSGTQVLPEGVYFYAPKAADVNGDGIATSREVSQNLVGVAMGKTPVYAEDSVCYEDMTFTDMTFKAGTASNISYMFINKETGAVEFVKKIDLMEGDTSVPIMTKEGCVSAMFIKQSTSGMFWFSEDVDDDVVDDVIKCLKKNNKSYKGHNAIAFGPGAHDLTYKKNKTVTYEFNMTFNVIAEG